MARQKDTHCNKTFLRMMIAQSKKEYAGKCRLEVCQKYGCDC
tara:strand:+ start:252 stop:377 length:126 start_codon:yes stop_codon:yes gene_type:complete